MQHRGTAGRIDLAAAHRLAFMHGFSEGIFNHLAFLASGRRDVETIASETAEEICNKTIQIHGGYGYLNGCPVERISRDVRVCKIYEGTPISSGWS